MSAASGDGGRGGWTRRGAVDEALDLDLLDVVGDRRRIGGLQRRRLRTDGRIGGDGDRVDFRSGDDGGVIGGGGQRLAARYIACVQRKDCYRFYMSARALSNASTSVERDVISVIRQNCGHAAATIPGAVMSVQVLSQCQSYKKHLVSLMSGSKRGPSPVDDRVRGRWTKSAFGGRRTTRAALSA